jgi:hypothetical protein
VIDPPPEAPFVEFVLPKVRLGELDDVLKAGSHSVAAKPVEDGAEQRKAVVLVRRMTGGDSRLYRSDE